MNYLNQLYKTKTLRVLSGMCFMLLFPYCVWAQKSDLRWLDARHLQVSVLATASDSQLSTNHRMVLTPVLCGAGGQEKAMSPMIFSGKRARKYFNRRAVLNKTERDAVHDLNDTLSYVTVIEAEPWMRQSELKLVFRREVEDCCDIHPLEAQTMASALYREPRLEWVKPILSVAEQIAAQNELLIPNSRYQAFDYSVPLRRMKGALYVHFPVSRSELNPEFRNNKETLARMLDLVKRIEADTLSSVKKIRIVGLASPEGPLPLNMRLSRDRAQVLKDYLCQNGVQLPQNAFELIEGGEAWADLRDVLQESDLENKEELIRIIDETSDLQEREKMLRRHQEAFAFLTRSVFVDQRNSGYIQVYYDAVADKGAHIINQASELLGKGKSEEALALLLPLQDDRKWNALGAAYYQNGNREAALEAFRKAVKHHNPGGEENLKTIQD